MNLPLENLSKKQQIIMVVVIAVIGVGIGLLSGNVFKTGIKPNLAGGAAPMVPTYSGRIFPAIDEATPLRFTHKLVDGSGETSAYLIATDDKLKVVLPTTNITVDGTVIGKVEKAPIIRVDKIKF